MNTYKKTVDQEYLNPRQTASCSETLVPVEGILVRQGKVLSWGSGKEIHSSEFKV